MLAHIVGRMPQASADQAENRHPILDFIFVRTNPHSDNEGERKWFIPEIIPRALPDQMESSDRNGIAQIQRVSDPPPLNWSTLRYVFGHEKEDCNAEEAPQA